jgi:6-pyruvoyltetrahydropterin/6-carboxytetrahydropterin synthase
MTVELSRRVYFCCSHRYHNPEWDDAKNREVFGRCNLPHGHGHNYTLDVTLRGEIDPETGMVMNLSDVDRIMKSEVMDELDHRNLNLDVAEFATRIPTTENLAKYIWTKIESQLPAGMLVAVRLWEDPTLWVEVR